MLASRQTILKLIEQGAIEGAKADRVGPVTYDLATKGYFVDAESYAHMSSHVVLMPGDSTFVASEEIVDVPRDYACRVLLRNSRIREGLRLDAPLYFPGHKTRVYFRVTNVSSCEIDLSSESGLAQIAFEPLDEPTDAPYTGAYVDEFSFKGMGDYDSRYGKELKVLEEKTDKLEELEGRIYGNVLAVMAIVAAVFTLVNVNIGIDGDANLKTVLCANLTTVGSISLLAGLTGVATKAKGLYARLVPWVLAVAAFIVDIWLVL